jgi:hypothetical protein
MDRLQKQCVPPTMKLQQAVYEGHAGWKNDYAALIQCFNKEESP